MAKRSGPIPLLNHGAERRYFSRLIRKNVEELCGRLKSASKDLQDLSAENPDLKPEKVNSALKTLRGLDRYFELVVNGLKATDLRYWLCDLAVEKLSEQQSRIQQLVPARDIGTLSPDESRALIANAISVINQDASIRELLKKAEPETRIPIESAEITDDELQTVEAAPDGYISPEGQWKILAEVGEARPSAPTSRRRKLQAINEKARKIRLEQEQPWRRCKKSASANETILIHEKDFRSYVGSTLAPLRLSEKPTRKTAPAWSFCKKCLLFMPVLFHKYHGGCPICRNSTTEPVPATTRRVKQCTWTLCRLSWHRDSSQKECPGRHLIPEHPAIALLESEWRSDEVPPPLTLTE